MLSKTLHTGVKMTTKNPCSPWGCGCRAFHRLVQKQNTNSALLDLSELLWCWTSLLQKMIPVLTTWPPSDCIRVTGCGLCVLKASCSTKRLPSRIWGSSLQEKLIIRSSFYMQCWVLLFLVGKWSALAKEGKFVQLEIFQISFCFDFCWIASLRILSQLRNFQLLAGALLLTFPQSQSSLSLFPTDYQVLSPDQCLLESNQTIFSSEHIIETIKKHACCFKE